MRKKMPGWHKLIIDRARTHAHNGELGRSGGRKGAGSGFVRRKKTLSLPFGGKGKKYKRNSQECSRKAVNAKC